VWRNIDADNVTVQRYTEVNLREASIVLGRALPEQEAAVFWKEWGKGRNAKKTGIDSFADLALHPAALTIEGVVQKTGIDSFADLALHPAALTIECVVGDCCTFITAEDTPPYVGTIERIFTSRKESDCFDDDGGWKVGAKVDALWEGRVIENGKHVSTSFEYPGEKMGQEGGQEGGNVSLLVRWFYLPAEAGNLKGEAKKRLLGSKGEILDSDHRDINDLKTVDSTFCSVTCLQVCDHRDINDLKTVDSIFCSVTCLQEA
ncbi:hypothetical protein T484DRAFT_1768018, partial [Baffinella frigidus]